MSEPQPSSSHDATGRPSSDIGDAKGVFVVEVTCEQELDDPEPPEPWLSEQLSRLAQLEGVESGMVTVTIVDDQRMVELHQRYRQEAKTTDVLSFDLRDDPAGAVEGDLVLCVDEARRQADQRGHEMRLELLLYALHGLLHLLGYDDRYPEDAQRMHRREDELLIRAGFGAVYGMKSPNDQCTNDR